LLGTTFALVALSASIAGITAGTAHAVPREGSCIRIYQSMSTSLDMAQAAYADGDQASYDYWMSSYEIGSANYDRYCNG
jgi:hypothetical protein